MSGGSVLKQVGKFFGLVALALGTAFAVPAVASASVAPSPSFAPDCKVVVVTLADRPDSGNHGTWATDQITRTAKVCHTLTVSSYTSEMNSPAWHYLAEVVDDGHFVTVTGPSNSPNAGHAVGHVVPGYLGGTYTATFTAPAHWFGWLGGDWNGKTLTGAPGSAANPTTSNYIKSLWKKDFGGNSIDNDWSWTYWTCTKVLKSATERWVDNYKTDGAGELDGDIVGKPCPTPSPSPSMTASAIPTPTVSTSAPGGLPVTGTKTDVMIGGGAALLLIGGTAVVLGRRRRTRFEA